MTLLFRRPPASTRSAMTSCRQVGGVTWRLYDAGLEKDFDLEVISSFAFAPPGKAVEGKGCRVLKEIGRRRIFAASGAGRELVIKAHDFSGSLSKQLLRHRFYAEGEADILLEATRRGLPVPRLLGFATVNPLGLICRRSLFVMEKASGSIVPKDVLMGRVTAPISEQEILHRVGLLFLQMYRGGLNHNDPNAHSMLLDAAGPAGDRIIDVQYSVFVDKPKPNLLSYALNHFARDFEDKIKPEYFHGWARGVLEAAGDLDVELQYQVYLDFLARRKPTTTERMQLS